jgi:ribosomal protein S21
VVGRWFSVGRWLLVVRRRFSVGRRLLGVGLFVMGGLGGRFSVEDRRWRRGCVRIRIVRGMSERRHYEKHHRHRRQQKKKQRECHRSFHHLFQASLDSQTLEPQNPKTLNPKTLNPKTLNPKPQTLNLGASDRTRMCIEHTDEWMDRCVSHHPIYSTAPSSSPRVSQMATGERTEFFFAGIHLPSNGGEVGDSHGHRYICIYTKGL